MDWLGSEVLQILPRYCRHERSTPQLRHLWKWQSANWRSKICKFCWWDGILCTIVGVVLLHRKADCTPVSPFVYHIPAVWGWDKRSFTNMRRSMQALCDQFSGEENSTRRIAEADRMKKYIHYKTKRSLSFEMFLTKCQKMFNNYDKEG